MAYHYARGASGYRTNKGSGGAYYRNKGGLNYHTSTGIADGDAPYFVAPLNTSSLVPLAGGVTLNNTTVQPTWRYLGGDCAVSAWTAATGETLTAAGSGTDCDVDQPIPLTDSTYKGVRYRGGEYFQSGTASAFATQDIYAEFLIRPVVPGSGVATIFSTQQDLTSQGWSLLVSNAGNLIFRLRDSGGETDLSAAITNGAWYFATVVVDRDEASGNGAALYLQSLQSDTADMSGEATIAPSSELTAFALGDGTSKAVAYTEVAYAAMYLQADWHGGGAGNLTEWDAYVADRWWQVSGIWPSRCIGDHTPLAATRASAAYLTTHDGTNAILHYVGAGWLRIDQQVDTNGDVYSGYLSELGLTNRCLQSQTFNNASWSKGVGGTISADAVEAPDRSLTADDWRETGAGGTDGTIQQAIAVTDTGAYAFSVYVKASNRNWINLQVALSGSTPSAYFDVTNGAIGTTSAVTAAYIEGPFHNGFYRCTITFTADTTGSVSHKLCIAEGDGDITLAAGSEQSSLYIWGGHMEGRGYDMVSSYIPTTTAGAQRATEVLTWDSDAIADGDSLRGHCTFYYQGRDYDRTFSDFLVYLYDTASETNDRIMMGTYGADVQFTQILSTEDPDGFAVGPSDIQDGDRHLCLASWRPGRCRTATDGTFGTDDTTVQPPNNLGRLAVGHAGSQPFDRVSDVRLYAVPVE